LIRYAEYKPMGTRHIEFPKLVTGHFLHRPLKKADSYFCDIKGCLEITFSTQKHQATKLL
jgi:hypothetical protein